MKIIYLTNNENTLVLYDWLIENGEEVILSQEKLSLSFVQNINPEMIISYNYSYVIKKEIIDYMKGNIINLHISMLPWNRGASPNFWSFIDDTPKGVTIHYIDEGLDTGDIIVQKEVFFDEKEETFQSTYNTLSDEIQRLFQANWEMIKEGRVVRIPQNGDSGTSHKVIDLDRIQKKIDFLWSDNIYSVKQKYSLLQMSERQG